MKIISALMKQLTTLAVTSLIGEENDFISLRSLVQEIVSVEDANSVKSLVDNTEQWKSSV